MTRDEKFRALSQVERGLLALLDDASKRELATAAHAQAYGLGDVIYARGGPPDAMYVIVSGGVRVVGQDSRGEETTLALLRRRGDHFGERSLLFGEARGETARASDDLVVLRVDREDFERILGPRPDVIAVLRRHADEAGVQAFVKELTTLGAAPAHVLRGLVSELQEMDVRAGDTVIAKGTLADRMYVVREGVLDVVADAGPTQQVLGQVGPGEVFGELALLAGSPRTASVVARTDCRLFALGKAGLDRALAASTALRASLDEQARSYRFESTRAPQGEPEAAAAAAAGSATAPAADRGARVEAGAEAFVRRGQWRRRFRRFPHVQQHDQSDCAAASLAMITKFYGVPVGLARLRDLANVDADGATLWSVAEAAESLGFHARGLQLSFAALSRLTLPAIVHWQGFHYIVLYAVGRRSVVVGDPARSLERMSIEDFRRGWTGRALELRPTARMTETEPIRRSYRRLLPIVRPHLGVLGEILAASFLLNLLGLGLPLFTQVVIDRVLVSRSVDLLDTMLGAMVLIVVFQTLIGASRRLMLVHVASRADSQLLGDYFRHVMALPLKFFDLRRVGDIVSRVSENDKVRAAMVGTIPGVILDVTMAVAYFALMAYYNVRLTLLVAGILPLFVVLMVVFTPVVRHNRREMFASRSDAWSYLIESVTGIGTVKAMAVESSVRWRLETLFARSIARARRGAHLDTAYGSVAGMLQALGAVLFLWAGARQVLRDQMTIGQLLAFTTLAASVLGPVLRLVAAWDEMQEVGNAIDRLNDVFDARAEEPPGRDLIAPRRLQGRLRFDGVTFKYSSSQDRPILDGVSFEIEPGEHVAVVGRSGSGKSTLGKLFLGLYAPTRGRILVDGHDLRTVSRRALRRRVGVVPQEVFLFSGTIRENIALSDPEIPFEKVVAAARRGGAHAFISELGMGYDTKVGERGMALSGGQRQRIALARALLHEPDVLILDEATSALDTESERAIQLSLEEVGRGRTTITIAHRLSTVQAADRILVIDGGNLVEQGSHAELLALGGLYASLVGQQVTT